jgi:hypothetical protein
MSIHTVSTSSDSKNNSRETLKKHANLLIDRTGGSLVFEPPVRSVSVLITRGKKSKSQSNRRKIAPTRLQQERLTSTRSLGHFQLLNSGADAAFVGQKFGGEHCSLGRAHFGVVRHQDVL